MSHDFRGGACLCVSQVALQIYEELVGHALNLHVVLKIPEGEGALAKPMPRVLEVSKLALAQVSTVFKSASEAFSLRARDNIRPVVEKLEITIELHTQQLKEINESLGKQGAQVEANTKDLRRHSDQVRHCYLSCHLPTFCSDQPCERSALPEHRSPAG